MIFVRELILGIFFVGVPFNIHAAAGKHSLRRDRCVHSLANGWRQMRTRRVRQWKRDKQQRQAEMRTCKVLRRAMRMWQEKRS